MNSEYNLFLDDIRLPNEVGNYFNPVAYRKLFRLDNWHTVRNYKEFVDCIEERGVPRMVSFDHDLADDHYVPQELWSDEKAAINYMRENTYRNNEKTGYDCALYLLEHCAENREPLPRRMLCHSMNPVGKRKIEVALEIKY